MRHVRRPRRLPWHQRLARAVVWTFLFLLLFGSPLWSVYVVEVLP